MVPPFKEEKLIEPVECKVLVVSGGKLSEPHRFTYLPEITSGKRNFAPILSTCLLGFILYLEGMTVYFCIFIFSFQKITTLFFSI